MLYKNPEDHQMRNNCYKKPESAHKDVDCVPNVMAHAHKQDFVFWRHGQVHLNRRQRQFSRLLAA